jgi:ABC-type antimicrobial peptide transport system permease subunit
VSDSDLLVLAPWAVFMVGLAMLIMLTVARSHGAGHRGRRRGRFRRR